MTRLTATSAFISSSPPHQWAHDPVALERDLCTGPRRRQDLFGSRSRWLQSAIGSIITRPAIYSESTANILLRVEVANPPRRRAARRREGGDAATAFKATRYQAIVAIFAAVAVVDTAGGEFPRSLGRACPLRLLPIGSHMIGRWLLK